MGAQKGASGRCSASWVVFRLPAVTLSGAFSLPSPSLSNITSPFSCTSDHSPPLLAIVTILVPFTAKLAHEESLSSVPLLHPLLTLLGQPFVPITVLLEVTDDFHDAKCTGQPWFSWLLVPPTLAVAYRILHSPGLQVPHWSLLVLSLSFSL